MGQNNKLGCRPHYELAILLASARLLPGGIDTWEIKIMRQALGSIRSRLLFPVLTQPKQDD